ncbi:MAG: DNA-directed polymerase subunit beta [Actinomycetota bacterium]
MLDATTFDEIRIGLATADQIRSWSKGEVKKPETINYRTLKPEKDGLFGEQIFGPTRDWECGCGKYKRVRFKGIVCERCGVEVTKSAVRRERMGHLELASPVTHIWYFKGVPSRLGYLLDMAPKDLEKVIYFAAYMITFVDADGRHEDLPRLEKELQNEIVHREKARDVALAERLNTLELELARLEAEDAKADIKRKTNEAGQKELAVIRKNHDDEILQVQRVFDDFKSLTVGSLKAEDADFRELQDRYGDYFASFMGAEAIKELLTSYNDDDQALLKQLSVDLHDEIANSKSQRKIRAIKRLKVVNSFLETGTNPASMVLDVIPVIPPELRPMVQLDGGRFATSDLNDLYRRVINRNNRLKRLLELGAPQIIINNEKRMLQESVDALFDNGRRGRPVTGTGNRALKSLSDMLKGKQGRFRQNLLGKRVDYSGRSVIVVGPQLKLHQCGLPKQMALELFKPFVIKQLQDKGLASSIKGAKRAVERAYPEVWGELEEIIRERPVLLNRAPTLHRLGIQAFEPQLVEGKAIQLHPLVCAAFNADFDGDQMAVHLPLSVEAQAEARILMLASNNILKPSDGRPVTVPTQDMIIGLHHLTSDRDGVAGEGRAFSSIAEATMAMDNHELHINAKIRLRVPGVVSFDGQDAPEGFAPGKSFHTTLGKAIFNGLLPESYPYVTRVADKGVITEIVENLAERYAKVEVAATLDRMKDAGFHWATRSGVTVALSDIVTPAAKKGIIEKHEKEAAKIESKYEKGLLSNQERHDELISVWTEATAEVKSAMQDEFSKGYNTINRMVTSGARGNWLQVGNIAGMRGLVANPKGEIIARPIINSYREGLSVAEYFIATHGARKGLADTALKTADSGYLTRRLVDVAQDVIIREADCGTSKGLEYSIKDELAREVGGNPENLIFGRVLVEAAVNAAGEVVADAGTDLGRDLVKHIVASGVEVVKARSPLTCEAQIGVCAACYGRSMATGKTVDLGEAVGIIAAQSIGEPGTQLTMRTFHTGGTAGAADITQGLPRVTELFEARTPKGASPIADFAGRVKVETKAVDGVEVPAKLILTPDNGDEERAYPILKHAVLLVEDGQHVETGDQLFEGTIDPKEVLRVKGVSAVQKFLVDGVYSTYIGQGVPVHTKHIEVIVRQMLRKVTIVDHGDTTFLPGELVDSTRHKATSREAVSEGKRGATARPEVMGITKASLATESWLSAASFQETTRVLTQAALEGKRDPLIGLKENVIIGKLIPAGTGLPHYRRVSVDANQEEADRRYPHRHFGATGSYADDAFSYADLDSFNSATYDASGFTTGEL